MRNDKIDMDVSVPLLSTMPKPSGSVGDPFALARRMQGAIWVFDIDNSKVIFANASACKLWNAKTEKELHGRNLKRDMSPTVVKRLRQYQNDFVERDASFKEVWTIYPNGKPKSVMVIFSGLYLPDGRMAMFCEVLGSADDEPDNLRSAEALLHTDVMIALYAKDGPPLYMNPAARNAATRAFQTISEKFANPTDYQNLISGLEKSGEHRMVARISTADGHRWHDLSAKLCSDAVTGEPAILVTATDVSELKTARDKARYLAERDQLTGCFNRNYLLQYMANLEQYQSKRCALLCFDIDHFKQINDRLGHEMGDAVLKKIVERTRSLIRKSDVMVRLGGDEFVIVFDGVASEKEFSPKLTKLLEKISEPITHDATRVNATVSIGVTTFLPSSNDVDAVLREADIALYVSKQAGRNRATFFSDQMGSVAKERETIEIELKRAIENREFCLHLQPRINLANRRVVSAEALVRWEHPERGLISPGEFIPVCEETGMIEDLGQLILEMGFEQALNWQNSGIDIGLSVNISPRQFGDKRLMQSLTEFAARPDFPHGKIELEITESVLVGDHGQIETKLEAISKMGYDIAIDDFGTGYSNLSYISRFPLNCLKIDQSFIGQLPKSGPIISLILTLAKQVGATIVAEGVETQDQLNWLTDNDCEQVQGYLLSRPVPIAKFADVMAGVNASLRMPKDTAKTELDQSPQLKCKLPDVLQ
jgi:diguanylate cyclase (GGDEF)-like protein